MNRWTALQPTKTPADYSSPQNPKCFFSLDSADHLLSRLEDASCADSGAKQGKIDLFERVISFEGVLDAAQRTKLLEIADKCPVHRTLHGEVKVVTRQG